MQAGKISKINKRAECNKAMQVGIFQKSIVKNQIIIKIPKIIKSAWSNRVVPAEKFQKINNFCSTHANPAPSFCFKPQESGVNGL